MKNLTFLYTHKLIYSGVHIKYLHFSNKDLHYSIINHQLGRLGSHGRCRTCMCVCVCFDSMEMSANCRVKLNQHMYYSAKLASGSDKVQMQLYIHANTRHAAASIIGTCDKWPMWNVVDIYHNGVSRQVQFAVVTCGLLFCEFALEKMAEN